MHVLHRSVLSRCLARMWFGPAFALAVIMAGCSRESGERRYDVSGRIIYRGEPVPAGTMLFSPDGAHGADGPATVADITDGRYRTRRGRGAVAGRYVVTIYGTDGTLATETEDNSLFPPYTTHVTIDRANTSHDFEVLAH